MIFLTGDTHGDIDIHKLNSKNFDSSDLTKDDFIIVLGDFGLVWNNSKEELFWRKWLDDKPWTTLFIDGNHENHTELDSMPVDIWHGGKVHYISNNIIHLMRGQIFELENRKFFIFGGADSIDKEHRKEHISWWKREMPSTFEYETGLKNLDKHHFSVDYILTHTCSNSIKDQIDSWKDITAIEKYFDVLEEKVSFKHWYFGHFHIDMRIDEKHTVLYERVIRLI